MFLFRDRQPASGGGDPCAANADAAAAHPAEGCSTSPSRSKPREFLAFKAARFLGGAARQVGASLARLTAGPSAAALRGDLEARASGQRGEADLAAAIAEWGRLLSATDDTPRYEAAGGGLALNFRAAFLWSRSFELALAVAGGSGAGAAGGAAGTQKSGGAGPAAALLDGPERTAAWRAFLRGAALPGGEGAAAELPELFALTRHFPDCRRWVDEAAAAVKADAKAEELRVERTAAAAKAEEFRASSRRAAQSGGGGGGGVGAPTTGYTAAGSPEAAACAASREAVGQYAAFRSGLAEAAAHLRDGVLTERLQRLRVAREALGTLAAEAEQRGAEAAFRREEVLQHRDEAVAEPRRAVELLENDEGRFAVDERGRELDEQRRELMIQLEETSQSLAAKRDARLKLLHQRDAAVAEHRWRTENVEKQLRELRPSQFHRAVGPRCVSMTEGEILAGLSRSAEAAHGAIASARVAASTSSQQRGEELEKQRVALEGQAGAALKDHARLQIARLEAAGSAVRAATALLLDKTRSRAASAAMGLLQQNEELLPSRRDVRKLRKALKVAEAAWEEVDTFWGSIVAPAEDGEDWLTSVASETRPSATSSLDAARGRIARSLEQLRQADPALYEMAVCASAEDDGTIEEAATPASMSASSSAPGGNRRRCGPGEASQSGDDQESSVPHGWEMHATAEGHVYYHSLVTRETQWEAPSQDAAVSAGWRLFQAEDGNWFYHNPYDGVGLWYPELPTYAAEPAPLEALLADTQLG